MVTFWLYRSGRKRGDSGAYLGTTFTMSGTSGLSQNSNYTTQFHFALLYGESDIPSLPCPEAAAEWSFASAPSTVGRMGNHELRRLRSAEPTLEDHQGILLDCLF